MARTEAIELNEATARGRWAPAHRFEVEHALLATTRGEKMATLVARRRLAERYQGRAAGKVASASPSAPTPASAGPGRDVRGPNNMTRNAYAAGREAANPNEREAARTVSAATWYGGKG